MGRHAPILLIVDGYHSLQNQTQECLLKLTCLSKQICLDYWPSMLKLYTTFQKCIINSTRIDSIDDLILSSHLKNINALTILVAPKHFLVRKLQRLDIFRHRKSTRCSPLSISFIALFRAARLSRASPQAPGMER